jgi:hypothetical protein
MNTKNKKTKVQGALQQLVELCVSMIPVVPESSLSSVDSVLDACKNGVLIRNITRGSGRVMWNSADKGKRYLSRHNH